MKYFILFIGLTASSPQTFAFDTWWHAECTRKAMVANGFSSDARLAVQMSNYITDFLAAKDDEIEKLVGGKLKFERDLSYKFMHFDAIYTNEHIEQNWQLLYDNTVRLLKNYATVNTVKPGFRLIVFFNIIGASLHIVQDFYSHSNWVNIYNEKRLGPPPIWYDVTRQQRDSMKLVTGAYPDGAVKGKLSHSDLNKDCSTRALNIEATETADRASIDWVKRLMQAVPEVPWGELKTYNIQNNMVMKKFLVQQDASFLTSSSIFFSHFDGDQPAKFVFANQKDITVEKTMATAALKLAIDGYAVNIALKGNEHKLPTPYWAGFLVYNIVREIATGFRHNNTTFKPPPKELKEYKPAPR